MRTYILSIENICNYALAVLHNHIHCELEVTHCCLAVIGFNEGWPIPSSFKSFLLPQKTKTKQYGPSKKMEKTTMYFSFCFSQATWQKAVWAAIQSGFLCSNQLSRFVPFWWAPHDLRWCSHITLQPGWRLKGRFQLKIDELNTKDGENLMLSPMELNHYDIVRE